MKSPFLTSLLILALAFRSFSQSQSLSSADGPDPASTLNYYEIQDTRINFFAVDSNYRLLKGTIYYIDRSGFIINLGWDSVKIKDDYYIILTYPKYTGDSAKDGRALVRQVSQPYFSKLSQVSAENFKRVLRDFTTSLPDSEKTIDPDTVALTAFDPGTAGEWKRIPLSGLNNLRLCIKKSDFDKLQKRALYSTAFKWNRLAFSSGQLTVPFKLRGATAGQNFSMTTDVTLGAYAGIKKRISKRQPFFVTMPVVLGLTYININNNTTTTAASSSSGVYPGFTLATGLIFQLGKFNMGVVTGWDWASGLGKTWIYQGKPWASFGLGYSFLN